MAVATLASIVDARGPARFRDPHILIEPSAWLLHGVALLVFAIIAGSLAAGRDETFSRRAASLALAAAACIAALAAGAGLRATGVAWSFPLADLVWLFDVTMLGTEVIAFALAIVRGTPGCEIGVWRELRDRRRTLERPLAGRLTCVVGLDVIDRWEAARAR